MASSTSDPTLSSDISTASQGPSLSEKDTLGSETSLPDSTPDEQGDKNSVYSDRDLKAILSEAFDENILAKALRTAARCLDETSGFSGPRKVPIGFPETVPQKGPNYGHYEYREPDFWTCGFFPGQLWALHERLIKYPQHVSIHSDSESDTNAAITRRQLLERVAADCAVWTEPLHAMADRKDTHDLGFIIMPALRREWELTSQPRSLDTILRAARSLATRYVSSAGVIRSWDVLLKKEISVTDMKNNVLVIIDSLCNLDLLFYAAAHGGTHDRRLASIAITHARALIETHLRPETVTTLRKDGYDGKLYSTCHVANVDPATGEVKWRWTAQGYTNDSTWSRGQAWAVLGYAQTYNWTKEPVFLEVACGVAEYFLYRLETAPACVESSVEDVATGTTKRVGRYVPLWDFDAPCDDLADPPPRDTSAGMIAANGLLLLSQALSVQGNRRLSSRFFEASVRIVRDTLDLSLAAETAFLSGAAGVLQAYDSVPGRAFDGVLKNGTANNNENARRRLADHGLVYGDYYLVEYGNRLMQMELV